MALEMISTRECAGPEDRTHDRLIDEYQADAHPTELAGPLTI